MKILTLSLFLIMLQGCRNAEDFRGDFEKHQFDATVINALPQYDTLRQLVLSTYDSFSLNETNYDFTYVYNFDSLTHIGGHSNTGLPQIIYPETIRLFESIGKANIFGFTVSSDSTFKILVRNIHLSKYFLDVRERLYWYPTPNRISKTEFPQKDTLITDQWQYQIWYDKRAEF